MATHRNSPSFDSRWKRQNQSYHPAQGLEMELGFIMMILSVIAPFRPNLFGLHLSLIHELILALTGLIALWSGLFTSVRVSFRVSLGLGVFFLLNALGGVFLQGTDLGNFYRNSADLKSLAPGFSELSTSDHFLHGIFAFAFLWDAFLWKRVRAPKVKAQNKTLSRYTIAGGGLFILFLIILVARMMTKN